MSSVDLPYIIAEPPESLQDEIVAWGYENIPDFILFEEEGYGRELMVHLTFLTNVDTRRKKEMHETLAMQKSVCCILGGLMVFSSNSKFDVVCIEVVNQEIRLMHQELQKNIIHEQLYPTFIPHITVAYVSKGQGEKFRGNTYFDGKSFLIDQLVVSHDRGKSQDKVRLLP